MGALEELAKSLYGADTQTAVAGANPYYKAQQVPDLATKVINQAVASNPTGYSMKEIIGTNLATGMMSGLLGGLGSNYQDTLMDRYSNQLSTGSAGGYLPKTLKTRANQQRGLFQAAQQAEAADLEKQLFLLGAKPVMELKGNMAAQGLFAKPGAGAGAGGAEGADESLSLLNPLNEKKFDAELKLAGEFKPIAQEYFKQEGGFKAMLEAYQDPEGTSDYELVRRAAQAVEPGLAVRKDDQDSIEGAASLFGQSVAKMESVVKGKSKLTPEVRAGIVRIAERGLKQAQQRYTIAREAARKQAEVYTLSPDRVAYQPAAANIADLTKGLNYSVEGMQEIAKTKENLQRAKALKAQLQAQRESAQSRAVERGQQALQGVMK